MESWQHDSALCDEDLARLINVLLALQIEKHHPNGPLRALLPHSML